MIRHGIFLSCSPGSGQAKSVSALTISMIELAFKAALMPAASLAPLCDTSAEATGMAAVAMPPVTVGTDEEHSAAIGRRTELLVEDEVVWGRHPGLGGGRWTEAPGNGNIALLFSGVASTLGRPKVKPRLLLTTGVHLRCLASHNTRTHGFQEVTTRVIMR